jgi:hypothetical protein
MAPPPGYVAYGSPASYGGQFSNIGGLAKWIVILQYVSIAFLLILIAVQASLVGKADDYLAGDITRTKFEDALSPYLLVSALGGLVSVAALVVTIIWSFRIARNLQNLGRQPLTWRPGLTIVVWILGGCTLSIINFLMLREHWKASDPEVAPGDQSWRTRPVSGLIVAWFVLNLAQIVVAGISGARSFGGVRFGNNTRNLAESLSDRLPLVILSGLAGAAAALLLIMIVRQMSARHMSATHEA